MVYVAEDGHPRELVLRKEVLADPDSENGGPYLVQDVQRLGFVHLGKDSEIVADIPTVEAFVYDHCRDRRSWDHPAFDKYVETGQTSVDLQLQVLGR